MDTKAEWAVIIVFGNSIMLLSSLFGGSFFNTSNAAPAIILLTRASYRSSWFISLPREVLIIKAVGFILSNTDLLNTSSVDGNKGV